MSAKIVIRGESEASIKEFEDIIIPPEKANIIMNIGDQIRSNYGDDLVVYKKLFYQLDDKFNYKVEVFVAKLL